MAGGSDFATPDLPRPEESGELIGTPGRWSDRAREIARPCAVENFLAASRHGAPDVTGMRLTAGVEAS